MVSGTATSTEENNTGTGTTGTGTEEDDKLLDSNSPNSSDLPTVLPSTPPPSASYLHQQLDSLEATLFPELTPAKEDKEDVLPTVLSQY